MTLEELFTSLSYGVLVNLSIGGSGSGKVPSEFQKRVVSHVNMSLTGLYGRFNLHKKKIDIQTIAGRNEYPLLKKHAVNDATTGVDKFIIDTAGNPFGQDVLKILAMFDVDDIELTLNDPGQENSPYTPTTDILMMPDDLLGGLFSLEYQSLHPKLLTAEPVDLTQLVRLPAVLVPALEAHVAYQIFSGMNGPEHTAKAMEQISRYEMLCGAIENDDLVSTSVVQTHTKLEDRGFV